MKLYITFIVFFLCVSSYLSAQLNINEVIPSNDTILTDNYGEYDDIIEIYNAGNAAVNLAGYYLSDDAANPTQWQIPATNAALTTIPAGGYLIFWADDETAQGANHLNFKLSSTGESIILTNPDGVTVEDSFTFPTVSTDYGYGRLPDGSTNLSQLVPATPAATNNNSQPKAEKPTFSIIGGPYGTTQTVTLSTNTPGSTIRYTTDGSEPNSLSIAYSGALTIDSITVLRARTFKNGYVESDIASETYLVGVSHDLPIICLNTAPDNLWNDSIGIHVVGTNGSGGNCSGTANWNQDWERPVNVQMYESDGTYAFNVDAGISIAGGCSRRYDQKSFNIATKKAFGSEKIEYQLFPESDQHEFRRFKLRNSGTDWAETSMRDGIAQSLVVGKVDIDGQRFRQSVVYLNGEYWGIMNIRDVFSEHYLKYKFPKIDKDSIDILFTLLGRIVNSFDIRVIEGDDQGFLDFYYFMRDNDMTDPANYAEAESRMDINELMNYYIVQVYVGNTDWPFNNVRVWRDQRAGGKFRWMFFDTDFGLGLKHTASNPRLANPSDRDNLYEVLRNDISDWPCDTSSTKVFRQLMENDIYKHEFIQRFATQLNVLFDTTRVQNIINQSQANIQSEMQDHLNKWGNNDQLVATWEGKVDYVRNWLTERQAYVRQHIMNNFGLNGTYNLTLNFDQNTGGVVVVNDNRFSVPFNYTGQYFDAIPIQLNAIPNPGYRFSHWQETGNTSPTLYQSFSSNTTRTPVFEAALDVVINEIHYNPNDSINEKEFIEIYNPDNKAWDLSGYEFSEGICFKFPKGTSIAAGEYLIIAADATQYLGNGYRVFQWEESKLNNDGEELILVNSIRTTIDSVRYNDGIPWAFFADGFGASLELNYPLPTDNLEAADWHASAPDGGTPGAQNSTPCTMPTQEIVINEINYNSDNTSNPGDWIELYNPNSTSVNISNWQFYDSGNAFTIPNGTILEADDYLVITENASIFGSIFPHLNNGTDYIGDLVFNLSNGGERISIFDQNKCLVDELKYDDEMLWDTIPDGNGPTLSLVTPNSDNTLPESWESSSNINSAYGTPGRANIPCFENIIEVPSLICTGIPTEIKVDSAYSDMDFTWFVSGATLSNFTTDSEILTWNTPGTYNIQLITNYYECTKVYFQPITVGDCNTAPNVVDDNFTTNEDNGLIGNVLTNDSDPENDGLTVDTTPINDVTNGTLTLNPDGTFDYTPDPNFYGTDSFTYQVCDNVFLSGFDASLCNTATVYINITPENDTPIAEDDVLSTYEENAVMGNVLINDFDVENTAGTCGINITQVLAYGGAQDNGTATILDNGATIMLENNAWKAIPFQYTITSNTVIEFDFKSTEKGESHDIGMDNNFGVNNGRRFKLYGTENVSGVQTDFHNYDGSGDYQHYSIPIGQYNGGGRNYIFFNVDSDANPTVGNSYFSNICVYEDLNGNGINDETNMSVTTSLITPPANGVVTIDDAGIYTYTPNPDFFGTDTFEYEICDNGSPALCDIASVTITVNNVNDAPMPTPDTLYMFANSTIQDNVLMNDADIENNNLIATIASMAAPINGSVTIQPNGNINYTPNPNFVGTDSFTYEVCDDGTPSMCATETVTIIVEPDCIDIQLAAWLEGAFDATLGEMRTTLVNTRKLLPGQTPASGLATPTPAGQPYSAAPWNYPGTEGAIWSDADYTGDEVDWLLVSFRTGIDKNTEVGMTAALLNKDGGVSFPDRCALLSTVASPLYIVLEHRNHIGVMTPQPVDIIGGALTYDFRLSDSYRDPTSFGQKQTPTGEWAMYAGDADQSDFPSFDINGTDKTLWFENNGVFDYYFSPDFNLDGDINGQDKSLWFENNGISSRVPK